MLGRVNTVNRLVRKRTLLVGLLCYMLCRKAKEDLDHLFGVSFASSRSARATIGKFLLHPPFTDKGDFYGWSGCVLLFGTFGARTIRSFRVKRGSIVRDLIFG